MHAGIKSCQSVSSDKIFPFNNRFMDLDTLLENSGLLQLYEHVQIHKTM